LARPVAAAQPITTVGSRLTALAVGVAAWRGTVAHRAFASARAAFAVVGAALAVPATSSRTSATDARVADAAARIGGARSARGSAAAGAEGAEPRATVATTNAGLELDGARELGRGARSAVARGERERREQREQRGARPDATNPTRGPTCRCHLREAITRAGRASREPSRPRNRSSPARRWRVTRTKAAIRSACAR
jgi:hypothetical protein